MRLMFFVVATLATISSIQAGPVSLLEGKLKLDTTDAFIREKEAKTSKQSIADFKGRKSDALRDAFARSKAKVQVLWLDSTGKQIWSSTDANTSTSSEVSPAQPVH